MDKNVQILWVSNGEAKVDDWGSVRCRLVATLKWHRNTKLNTEINKMTRIVDENRRLLFNTTFDLYAKGQELVSTLPLSFCGSTVIHSNMDTCMTYKVYLTKAAVDLVALLSPQYILPASLQCSFKMMLQTTTWFSQKLVTQGSAARWAKPTTASVATTRTEANRSS